MPSPPGVSIAKGAGLTEQRRAVSGASTKFANGRRSMTKGLVDLVYGAMASFDASHQPAPYSDVDRTGLPILLSAYSSR